MRTEAADFFHEAASKYMADAIEQAKVQGGEGVIASSVREIRTQLAAVGSLRSQLFMAVITAVLVPVILGGAIFSIREFDKYMPNVSSYIFSTNPPAASPPSPAPPR